MQIMPHFMLYIFSDIALVPEKRNHSLDLPNV